MSIALDDAAENQQQRQKVVILAGPHKTASSTTQKTLVQLAENNLLGNYEWPTALQSRISKKESSRYAKQFQYLISNLWEYRLDTARDKDHYKAEFQKTWESNRSIVFGSEMIGTFSNRVAANGNQSTTFLKNLRDILPKGRKNMVKNDVDEVVDIDVVLNFRSKRLEHLTSAWSQTNVQRHKNLTFKKWMCSIECDGP